MINKMHVGNRGNNNITKHKTKMFVDNNTCKQIIELQAIIRVSKSNFFKIFICTQQHVDIYRV